MQGEVVSENEQLPTAEQGHAGRLSTMNEKKSIVIYLKGHQKDTQQL